SAASTSPVRRNRMAAEVARNSTQDQRSAETRGFLSGSPLRGLTLRYRATAVTVLRTVTAWGRRALPRTQEPERGRRKATEIGTPEYQVLQRDLRGGSGWGASSGVVELTCRSAR